MVPSDPGRSEMKITINAYKITVRARTCIVLNAFYMNLMRLGWKNVTRCFWSHHIGKAEEAPSHWEAASSARGSRVMVGPRNPISLRGALTIMVPCTKNGTTSLHLISQRVTGAVLGVTTEEVMASSKGCVYCHKRN